MFCGFKDKHRNAALTTFNNAIKDWVCFMYLLT
jgi:hypothetical protein